MGGGDTGLKTPVHWHRHLAAAGTIMVPTTPRSAAPSGSGAGSSSAPFISFTPPGASPETTRLLGSLGIKPGDASSLAAEG